MVGYQEVNAGMKKVIEYLQENEKIWNQPRNLKLYDVCFHEDEILDKYPLVKQEYDPINLFNYFCESEYDNFTEWMQEENIDPKTMVYIGRTSSFYLTDINDKNIGYVINNIYDSIDGRLDIDDDGNMIPFTDTDYFTESELIDEYQESMEYIADGSFLKDVKEYMRDAVRIAEYIDDFKKDQIRIFTEFIEYRNEELEEEQERAAAEAAAFKERYADEISTLSASISQIKDQAENVFDLKRIIRISEALVTGED